MVLLKPVLQFSCGLPDVCVTALVTLDFVNLWADKSGLGFFCVWILFLFTLKNYNCLVIRHNYVVHIFVAL